MANWAELDPYLLADISRRITSHGDFIAFRRVYISWRSDATIKKTFMYKDSQMPWLMLAPKKYTNLRDFLSISKGHQADSHQASISRQAGSAQPVLASKIHQVYRCEHQFKRDQIKNGGQMLRMQKNFSKQQRASYSRRGGSCGCNRSEEEAQEAKAAAAAAPPPWQLIDHERSRRCPN
ncbi:hypothetical protein QYF36_012732 [Acer negundo]|nr:hypothetical protein QYF36_012732 [Acer negundo]